MRRNLSLRRITTSLFVFLSVRTYDGTCVTDELMEATYKVGRCDETDT